MTKLDKKSRYPPVFFLLCIVFWEFEEVLYAFAVSFSSADK